MVVAMTLNLFNLKIPTLGPGSLSLGFIQHLVDAEDSPLSP
jgi:hypothetical protein